jgi:LCP family protein required for cell wall assembly
MESKYTVKVTNKEIKKAKRNSLKILLCFIFIFITLIIGGYFFRNYVTSCEGTHCNPFIQPFINTIEPNLDQDNGLTNILLVGIDTRENNQGLMNTDTIIIVTIDYANRTIILTSIPRDFWVRYDLPNGNVTSSKVNSVYASGEWQEEGEGINTLKGAVEDIIGEPIHYHAKVTLQGFIEAIDTIGGIDIEITEYYKDAYPASELPYDMQESCAPYYHDGKYCIFTLEEGMHHLDGQMSLIYARSRILSPTGDFDRARRQQQVITAVKNKILSTETLLDPGKILDLLQILEKNVEMSTFNINDIRAALSLKDKMKTDEVGTVVLDPYFGNKLGKYIYVPPYNPNRGYHIMARDQTYEQIQGLLVEIRENPVIYKEAPTLSFYNATGNYYFLKDWSSELEEKTQLINIYDTARYYVNDQCEYDGINIYYFGEEPKPATEEFLKNLYQVEYIISNPGDGTKNLRGEDFVVVIGTEEEASSEL